jgi:hypothetical protein
MEPIRVKEKQKHMDCFRFASRIFGAATLGAIISGSAVAQTQKVGIPVEITNFYDALSTSMMKGDGAKSAKLMQSYSIKSYVYMDKFGSEQTLDVLLPTIARLSTAYKTYANTVVNYSLTSQRIVVKVKTSSKSKAPNTMLQTSFSSDTWYKTDQGWKLARTKVQRVKKV